MLTQPSKKIILCLLFWGFCFAGLSFAQDLDPSGPIPVTNQHPFYIFFLNPTPDKVDIQESGKLALDLRYAMANINVRQYSYPPDAHYDQVELDMEIHKLDLDFRYGLNEQMDLELDIPYLIFWEGFLDSVVDFFEDSLGVMSPSSRGDWGTNRYKYFLRSDSKTYIDREEGENGIGDTTLFLKYKFIDEQRYLPSMAIRTGIKFPTGSKDNLLGSGEFDYDVGILFQKQISKLFLYFNLDSVFIARPKVLDSMPLDNYMISGFLGMEYFLNKRFSLLFQSGLISTPYPAVDEVTSLQHSPGHIGLGINYKFSQNSSLKFSVIENISSASPDIILQTGLNLKF